MESFFRGLTASTFLNTWTQFDRDDDGFIDAKNLGEFLRRVMKTSKTFDEQQLQKIRDTILSSCEVTGGRLSMEQLAAVVLHEEENFLLLFRRETPLENSVEFMRVRTSHSKSSSSGFSYLKKFEANCHRTKNLGDNLSEFQRKCFKRNTRKFPHSSSPAGRSTRKQAHVILLPDFQMKMFDKNQDGRLDLNDLARILALKENFLLKFEMKAGSQEDRRRDFEKIFAHYDVSNTNALEGEEVDGFVKDMMELVKPSLSGPDLDKFKLVLLGHCDLNGDGKIQKNELAMCLGLKL
ncbi:unnamed protein product [Leuciscus chuanchicus]